MKIDRVVKIIVPTLVFIALAALCIYMVQLEFRDRFSYAILAFCGGLIVTFPLCTVFHELGHMFFGHLVKFKAVPHFTFFKASSCDIIPKCSKGIKGRMIATTMGGLVFNLILISLGIVALTVREVPTYLSVFMPYSAYLLVLNSIPTYYLDGKSDALVAKELLLNTDSAKVTVAVLTAQGKISEGEKIEDMQNLLFDLPQIQEDDAAFIALTDLRAKYFSAIGDDVNAKIQSERFEELKEEYL